MANLGMICRVLTRHLPEGSPLAVGDLVGFGISHPCLTFDKWRVLHLVDADYTVLNSVRTYF